MISDELRERIDEHVRKTVAGWRKPDAEDLAVLKRIVGPVLRRDRDHRSIITDPKRQ